jgi:hypothetical protein
MADIKDFNSEEQRVESASAVFQKSIYHLFILRKRKSTDIYEKVIRSYQSLFLLCSTQLLLDMNFKISANNIQKRLQELCNDPQKPTCKELDPSAVINHSTFTTKWNGFPKDHPLENSSKHSIKLYTDVVEARHNMIYRPFLLDNYWEDCTLINLLESLPEEAKIEATFREFLEGIIKWRKLEDKAPYEKKNGVTIRTTKPYTNYFLMKLFVPYKDVKGSRPTETLYMTYARMLNQSDEELLQLAKEYRNELIEVEKLVSYTDVLDEWKPGEL